MQNPITKIFRMVTHFVKLYNMIGSDHQVGAYMAHKKKTGPNWIIGNWIGTDPVCLSLVRLTSEFTHVQSVLAILLVW